MRSPKAMRTAVGFPDVAFVFTWHCPGKRRPDRIRFASARPCRLRRRATRAPSRSSAREHLTKACAEVRRAGALWRNRPDTEWHWTFRLLEADILLEQADLSRARALLESDLEGCREYCRVEIRRRSCWRSCSSAAAHPIPARLRRCWRRLAQWPARGTCRPSRGDRRLSRPAAIAPAKNLDPAERTWRRRSSPPKAPAMNIQNAAATNNLGLLQQRRSRCDESTAYFDRALAGVAQTRGRPG